MTVPHCYPSVVHNTLEVITHGVSEVGVIIHTVINSITTPCLMRGSTHVDAIGRTKVTVIVTTGAGVVTNDTVVEAVRGTSNGIALVDIREAMGWR